MSSGPWIENAMREVIRLFLLAGSITVGAITMAGNIILGAFGITTTNYTVSEQTVSGGQAIEIQNNTSGIPSWLVLQSTSATGSAGAEFSMYPKTGASDPSLDMYVDAATLDMLWTNTSVPFTLRVNDGSNTRTWSFNATTQNLTLSKGLVFGSNGAFTSTEQTSSQAVAHGLGKTPQQFWVEVTDSGATGIYTQTSTADGTNVTVTCTVGLKYKVHAF